MVGAAFVRGWRREADAAAGTYTFGARTYDPTLRRWVSPDPLLAVLPNLDLHVGDALTLYGYADGNPVKHVDNSGAQSLNERHRA